MKKPSGHTNRAQSLHQIWRTKKKLKVLVFITAFFPFGVTMDKGRSTPGWVGSSLHGPIWAVVGLAPCSKVSQQCSECIHSPSPTTRTFHVFVRTGAWTKHPLLRRSCRATQKFQILLLKSRMLPTGSHRCQFQPALPKCEVCVKFPLWPLGGVSKAELPLDDPWNEQLWLCDKCLGVMDTGTKWTNHRHLQDFPGVYISPFCEWLLFITAKLLDLRKNHSLTPLPPSSWSRESSQHNLPQKSQNNALSVFLAFLSKTFPFTERFKICRVGEVRKGCTDLLSPTTLFTISC